MSGTAGDKGGLGLGGEEGRKHLELTSAVPLFGYDVEMFGTEGEKIQRHQQYHHQHLKYHGRDRDQSRQQQPESRAAAAAAVSYDLPPYGPPYNDDVLVHAVLKTTNTLDSVNSLKIADQLGKGNPQAPPPNSIPSPTPPPEPTQEPW